MASSASRTLMHETGVVGHPGGSFSGERVDIDLDTRIAALPKPKRGLTRPSRMLTNAFTAYRREVGVEQMSSASAARSSTSTPFADGSSQRRNKRVNANTSSLHKPEWAPLDTHPSTEDQSRNCRAREPVTRVTAEARATGVCSVAGGAPTKRTAGAEDWRRRRSRPLRCRSTAKIRGRLRRRRRGSGP